MLDGLVTDPEAPAPLRDKAIDLVVAKVFGIAKELGIKGLMAHTRDNNTLYRSLKFGFVRSQDALIFAPVS